MRAVKPSEAPAGKRSLTAPRQNRYRATPNHGVNRPRKTPIMSNLRVGQPSKNFQIGNSNLQNRAKKSDYQRFFSWFPFCHWQMTKQKPILPKISFLLLPALKNFLPASGYGVALIPKPHRLFQVTLSAFILSRGALKVGIFCLFGRSGDRLLLWGCCGAGGSCSC